MKECCPGGRCVTWTSAFFCALLGKRDTASAIVIGGHGAPAFLTERGVRQYAAMEAEVSAGWTGLAGASVGAAGALLGGWLQQRSQAKIAKRERHELRAIEAGDTALAELLHLQRQLELARASLGQVPPAPLPYRDDIAEHSRAAEVALLRMPDAAALRLRMRSVFDVLNWYETAGRSPALKIKFALTVTQDGVELLSAFLRGEPLPNSSAPFLELQTMVLRRAERARLLAETDGMVQDDD